MNLNELANNLEMAEEEFLGIIELFLDTSTSDLNHLQSAAEKGEALKAAKAAHSIKGAAMNLGLTEIYELAKKTEEEARDYHLDEASQLARAIKEKLNGIAEGLEGSKRQTANTRE